MRTRARKKAVASTPAIVRRNGRPRTATASSRIYADLRAELVSLQRRPGEAISEAEIALSYGVRNLLEQHAERGSEEQQRDDRRDQQRQVAPVGSVVEREQENDEHDALQEEVDERGADRGQGEDLAGKRPSSRSTCRPPPILWLRKRGGEQVPYEDAARQIDGEVRDPVLQDELEDDVIHRQRRRRVQHRPEEPEDALLVLDLQLFAHQPEEQLSIAPDVAQSLRQRDLRGDDATGNSACCELMVLRCSVRRRSARSSHSSDRPARRPTSGWRSLSGHLTGDVDRCDRPGRQARRRR